MLNIRSYTGGFAMTNGYLFEAAGGTVLVDAPDGIASWLATEGVEVGMLLLTHGHYDHVMDAAKVREVHGCDIYSYEAITDDLTLVALMAEVGMPVDLKPFAIDHELAGREKLSCLGTEVFLKHVPGHSPDSLCFLIEDEDEAVLFGGDVVFEGSIGRTDFPHGNHDLLIEGIGREVLSLDDAVTIYPGHGPATTVGAERRSNPYLPR
jgi:glyoxylase-like metal-dependent hydrolase (beta-lactamase superfamily II)